MTVQTEGREEDREFIMSSAKIVTAVVLYRLLYDKGNVFTVKAQTIRSYLKDPPDPIRDIMVKYGASMRNATASRKFVMVMHAVLSCMLTYLGGTVSRDMRPAHPVKLTYRFRRDDPAMYEVIGKLELIRGDGDDITVSEDGLDLFIRLLMPCVEKALEFARMRMRSTDEDVSGAVHSKIYKSVHT